MIYSDHKPLQHLFNESKGMPAMASVYIQQWALVLSAYTDNIVFKPGRQNANADVLSWLPLRDSPDDVPLPEETILLSLSGNTMEKLGNCVEAGDCMENMSKQLENTVEWKELYQKWPPFIINITAINANSK